MITKIKTILALKLTISELVALWNVRCNNVDADSIIYLNDEYFFKHNFESMSDVARAVACGKYNCLDNYAYLNCFNEVKTFTEITDSNFPLEEEQIQLLAEYCVENIEDEEIQKIIGKYLK